jgi:hypothetical protein
MTTRPRLTRLVLIVIACALGAASAFSVPDAGAAQDRATLQRLLDDNGRDFRVRVQAAFAMGNTRDAAFGASLSRALTDTNPAVRAAAATALGRLGDPSTLPALQRALRDSSAAVRLQVERAVRSVESAPPSAGARQAAGMPAPLAPAAGLGALAAAPGAASNEVNWRDVRYAVTLGEMRNRSGFERDALAQKLRSEVERNLRMLRGVAVLSGPDARAEREIAQRRLPRLRFEGNLAKVERRAQASALSVRCEVSLVLLDEPGRNMRGALNGAATGSDAPRGARPDQERRLAEQALEGAVRGAMRQAPAALASVAR